MEAAAGGWRTRCRLLPESCTLLPRRLLVDVQVTKVFLVQLLDKRLRVTVQHGLVLTEGVGRRRDGWGQHGGAGGSVRRGLC